MSEQQFIVWKPDYMIGVAELDGHHQTLVSIINRLYRSRMEPDAGEDVGALLREAVEYSSFHFRAEELLMHQTGFPELMGHCLKHQAYREELERLIREGIRRRDQLSEELFRFLKGWWLDHILTADMRLSRFLESAPASGGRDSGQQPVFRSGGDAHGR